jgi:hypothetical protein
MEPLRAFEPLTEAESADPAVVTYASAFAKLEAGDPGALPAFASLLGMRADDCLASCHLKRLLTELAVQGLMGKPASGQSESVISRAQATTCRLE